MIQKLLSAGMLSGLIVALIAFAFARQFAEPTIDRAIALETLASSHVDEDRRHDDHEGGKASRDMQRGAGLFTGIASYCVALGGFVAIASAAAHGRTGLCTRSNVWLVVLSGFLSMVIVPQLKYPASPPGVGGAETIDSRTALFFLLLLFSMTCMAVAGLAASRLKPRLGTVGALAVGLVVFVVFASMLSAAFPTFSEVPDDFPRGLLLVFRASSAILHMVIWVGLGLVFAPMARAVMDQGQAELSWQRRLPDA